jgi:hypothetical protein
LQVTPSSCVWKYSWSNSQSSESTHSYLRGKTRKELSLPLRSWNLSLATFVDPISFINYFKLRNALSPSPLFLQSWIVDELNKLIVVECKKQLLFL